MYIIRGIFNNFLLITCLSWETWSLKLSLEAFPLLFIQWYNEKDLFCSMPCQPTSMHAGLFLGNVNTCLTQNSSTFTSHMIYHIKNDLTGMVSCWGPSSRFHHRSNGCDDDMHKSGFIRTPTKPVSYFCNFW